MLKIGVVVRLRSGGLPMVVTGIEAVGGLAVCSWMTPDSNLRSIELPAAALQVVEEGSHLDGTWALDGSRLLNEQSIVDSDFDGDIVGLPLPAGQIG